MFFSKRSCYCQQFTITLQFLQIAPRGLIGGGLPEISAQTFTTEDVSNYTFTSDINLSNNFTAATVCSGSYCCNFNISIEQADTSEYYKYVTKAI